MMKRLLKLGVTTHSHVNIPYLIISKIKKGIKFLSKKVKDLEQIRKDQG